MHNVFNVIVIFLIIGNTIVLALDRYPIDQSEFDALEITNEFITWCFFTEMITKICGLGFKGYSRDRFNLFDCFIVVVSFIESLMSWVKLDNSILSGGAISAFRGVRLLRVFKLARSWKSFQVMLVKIGKTVKDISSFSVLLFLFMFVYCLLGMELFGYKVKYNDDDKLDDNGQSPRANFDTFIMAFTTVFIVLTGEVRD
jgi:voltage-dependent calcium channel L type alpha-1D